MEKVDTYKKIVRRVVENVAALSLPIENGIENQLITDDEHGHYLYFGVGWEGCNTGYFYASFVHIDVKTDGKVWLQHDGTSLHIAQQLTEKGIPKSDIVIGFQAPAIRPYMDGYALS